MCNKNINGWIKREREEIFEVLVTGEFHRITNRLQSTDQRSSGNIKKDTFLKYLDISYLT